MFICANGRSYTSLYKKFCMEMKSDDHNENSNEIILSLLLRFIFKFIKSHFSSFILSRSSMPSSSLSALLSLHLEFFFCVARLSIKLELHESVKIRTTSHTLNCLFCVCLDHNWACHMAEYLNSSPTHSFYFMFIVCRYHKRKLQNSRLGKKKLYENKKAYKRTI